MNVAPALSPDGKWVALFARRGLFTVDLFVADANTGKVVKKLTGPNADPHFDALSFVSASGSWSPDARKLAFITFEQGDNRITIFDVRSRDEERSISVRGVGAITDAAWSPDGRSIAISGTAGGISDLYLIDVSNGQVRRLTNDRFADLHPAWSPDGKSIAFASDRGPTTSFDSLQYGEMNLSVLDVGSGNVRQLEIFPGTKHINPQFSPDGSQLYFISDREGYIDIYRLDIASKQVFQVTRLATGVSGITALSPALSVARQTGRLVFSVFDHGGNVIHALSPEQAQGTLVPTGQPNTITAARNLTPVDASATSMVEAYLADGGTGLPPANITRGSSYKPKLQLAYLGAPTVGVGISNQSYGNGISGAVFAGFSDMLETREVGAALAAQGTFKDIGGEVYYKSTKRRWNWLTGLSHVAYVQGFQNVAADVIDETPVYRVDQILQRVFVDNAAFTTQYPFSQTKRIEFTASFNRYGYDNETRSFFYLPNGQFLGERESDLGAPPSLSFGMASIALVGDYSYFGFSSPVAGGRYRFEVSPSVGQINFTTVLGDYRRYIFAQPFTFAMRGMYYGRFGPDAEDQSRLSPLFLGQETLVRGYDVNDFDASECTALAGVGGNECPEFDRLLGSRIGVANFEIRFPLLGVREFGLINFPYLPTEIAPFFDVGAAWSKDDSPELTFSRNTNTRVPVFSTGISARMNVLGYMVLEAYYAYPFQRPERGAHFGFVLSPGW